ncbi:hypothetical protein DH2020_047971 [Rehmannia glutinosa]|uniref:Bromodomain associated domain-containing protein n=1 Tax=Rehmannia glutinosa TaxID=99300 RepID=A0ABR0U702_REHGL
MPYHHSPLARTPSLHIGWPTAGIGILVYHNPSGGGPDLSINGLQGAQISALEALTDVATRYLQAIAKLAVASANSGGRTQSNLPDIIVALEDLASLQGFPGNSSIRSRSLYTSTVIKDSMKFVEYTDEIPFARPLPPRKIFCQGAKGKYLKYRGDGDNSRGYRDGDSLRHVPRWLPAVPVVEGKEKGEEGKREVKWGCLDGRTREEKEDENWRFCDERKRVERVVSNKEIEISGKRGKVRFKMGVAIHNPTMVGNLRGAGTGKRVWCD